METTHNGFTLEDALELKDKGNALIKEGNFKEAALLYTQAIKIDPTNASLFSNRSLAYLRLNLYSLAYHDALETIRLHPQWAKGYFRKAEVEAALGLAEDAALSYTQTLQLQPQDVTSVLTSIKRVTDEQKRKREVRDKIPWVSCCVGVIIGVILVILDYALLKHESPRNPLLQVGTVILISFTSYSVGRYYFIVEQNDGRKQLFPPGFRDPDSDRQPWVIGCVCFISLLFLDLMYVEIIGIKDNPMKTLTLLLSIVGGGVGITYFIHVFKYISNKFSHEMTSVDCKLPFICGSFGVTVVVIGFVFDFVMSEDPSTLNPLNKGAVAFFTGCIFWSFGKVYNMCMVSHNKSIQKNDEESGGLPDSLWCAGLIVSILFIIVDCTVADVIGLRENPLKTTGFALSVAGSGYGLGSLLSYLKSFENEKPEEVIKDFQTVTEESQMPEKISNKYTKAQARYRYKKGKM